MPALDGKRTSLASYTWGGWGGQNDLTRFRDVFQPDRGSFSPGYPLVPPEREQVRVWDYPVGFNTIYTPRSYEAIGFGELRALAESHDITRLAVDEPVNPLAVAYVNRLSDHLFVLARFVNERGRADVLWRPGANR